MVNKVAQRAIAAGLAGMMSFGAVAPAAMALDNSVWSSWWNVVDTASDEGLTYWRRIAGSDRYETMKKIVQASYKIGGDYWWQANVAVVASGDNFPDALAANGLAGALNGGDGAPVILTKKGSLTSDAKELLKKMSVQTVYIMGGTSAVSADVEQAIKDMKIATIRVAGADRQATSVEAFKLIDGNWYKNHGTHSVIIATGANFADALSIAPFAYRTGTPVVLTKSDGTLTDEAAKAIKDNDEIWQVIVVGGTEAVSDSVFSVLGTYTGSYKDYYNKVYVPIRIAGADRYDTSAKIADWEVNYALDPNAGYWAATGFSFYETFVATGENFPDALAGGQLAGGKYYASSSVKTQANRWNDIDYVVPTVVKDASPILLTKDGNRAADSVIASNLAWNPFVKSVDSYEFCDSSLSAYIDDLLSGGISTDVYLNDADGFFTDTLFASPDSTELSYLAGRVTAAKEAAENAQPVDALYPLDEILNVDGSIKDDFDIERIQNQKYKDAVKAYKDAYEKFEDAFEEYDNDVNMATAVSWFDGYRVVDNNFHGVILGGKAAVSKDKAKQLDETVKDTILKWNDSVAGTTSKDSYVITAGGKTYRTLGWFLDRQSDYWSTVLGVSGIGTATSKHTAWKDTFTVNEVVAIPYGFKRYLYQPVGLPEVVGTAWDKDGATKETVTIKMAVFDRDASFSTTIDNSYTGYGFLKYGTLTVDYDFNAKTVSATWVDGIV